MSDILLIKLMYIPFTLLPGSNSSIITIGWNEGLRVHVWAQKFKLLLFAIKIQLALAEAYAKGSDSSGNDNDRQKREKKKEEN